MRIALLLTFFTFLFSSPNHLSSSYNLTHSFFDNRSIAEVVALLESNDTLIDMTPHRLRENQEFLTLLLHQKKRKFRPLLRALWATIALKEVRDYSRYYCFLPRKLQSNASIYQAAFANNSALIGCYEGSANLQIYKEAIKRNFINLKNAPKQLRDDPIILLEAIRQNPIAMLFATNRLRGDKAFALKAIKIAPAAYLLLRPSLKKDKKIMHLTLTLMPQLERFMSDDELKAIGKKRKIAFDSAGQGYGFEGDPWLFFSFDYDEVLQNYENAELYSANYYQVKKDIDGDGVEDQIITLSQKYDSRTQSRYIVIDCSKATSLRFESSGYNSFEISSDKGIIKITDSDYGLWSDGYDYFYSYLPLYKSWYHTATYYSMPHMNNGEITTKRDTQKSYCKPLYRIDGKLEVALLPTPRELLKSLSKKQSYWLLNINADFFDQMVERFAIDDKNFKTYYAIALKLQERLGFYGPDEFSAVDRLYKILFAYSAKKPDLYKSYASFLRYYNKHDQARAQEKIYEQLKANKKER